MSHPTLPAREAAVLAYAASHCTPTGRRGTVRESTVAEGLGITRSDAAEALDCLFSAMPPYLEPDGKPDGQQQVAPVLRATERGLRTVGVWPSDEAAGEALVAALRGAIERTTDPAEKTKLQRLLSAFSAVGQVVAGGVMTAAINGQIGS